MKINQLNLEGGDSLTVVTPQGKVTIYLSPDTETFQLTSVNIVSDEVWEGPGRNQPLGMMVYVNDRCVDG
jgi:hypothetical protein